MTRLFLGNISYQVNEDDLRAALTAIGIDAKQVIIGRDRTTGGPRGFGFIDVEDQHVEHALEVAQGAIVGDRPLRIERANAQAQLKGGGSPRGGGSRRPTPRGDFPGRGRRESYDEAWRGDPRRRRD